MEVETPAPPAPAPRRRPLLLLTAGAAVVLVAAAVAVVVLTRSDGPSHPDEWDERVVDLVEFVEDERGHDFEHPVTIDFLSEAEYAERSRTDATDLTEEEQADLEHAEGLFRAFGLVQGDFDFLEAANDLSDTGTLAFYDGEEERVTVRGTEVTPALSATLVHELTHALQDQVFGLDLLEDDDEEESTSGARLAFRALVEGDASRIEDAYVETLDDDVVEEIADAEADGLEDLEAEEVPDSLTAFFAMPYVLGSGFLQALAAEGDDAIDDAFRDPPSTEEHLLDPASYLDGQEADAVTVEAPDGAEVADEGDFGAASLYLVLASRLDPVQALQAAVGWGGDAYVTYRQDGRTCADLAVVGDDDADGEELAVAMEAWVAGGGPDDTVEVVDGEVRLHTCDPGDDGGSEPRPALDALSVAALRTTIVLGTVESGGEADFAGCYADAVLSGFTVEELLGDAEPERFQDRLADAAAGCL